MTTPTDTKQARKMPAPLYAAAGAGDLAYQELRKLPERVAELRGKVADLRPAVTVSNADIDKVRHAARRSAAEFVKRAQDAQERATRYYTRLVAHGEQVVRSGRTQKRAVTASPEQHSVPDKAAKRARPAATAGK
jgi:hypothetical protein